MTRNRYDKMLQTETMHHPQERQDITHPQLSRGSSSSKENKIHIVYMHCACACVSNPSNLVSGVSPYIQVRLAHRVIISETKKENGLDGWLAGPKSYRTQYLAPKHDTQRQYLLL